MPPDPYIQDDPMLNEQEPVQPTHSYDKATKNAAALKHNIAKVMTQVVAEYNRLELIEDLQSKHLEQPKELLVRVKHMLEVSEELITRYERSLHNLGIVG